MPRHYQTTVRPLKPQVVAPLATTVEGLAEIPLQAQPPRFARAETYVAPPKALPPAAITINHWFSTDGRTAIKLVFNLPECFIRPLKPQVIAPLATTVEGLAEIPLQALPPRFARAETYVVPPKALPPGITTNQWFSTDGRPAVELVFNLPECFVAPAKSLAVAPEIVTLDKWNPAAAPVTFTFKRMLPEASSAPVLPQPTAIMAAVFAQLLWNALRARYVLPENLTAPGIAAVSAPAVAPLAWLLDVPALAWRRAFQPPEDRSAPAKVLPALENVTLDKWNPAAAAALYRAMFSMPDGWVAPLFSPSIATAPLAWLLDVPALAWRRAFQPPEDRSAPAKVLPALENIMPDKWNPAAAAALYRAMFSMPDGWVAPVFSPSIATALAKLFLLASLNRLGLSASRNLLALAASRVSGLSLKGSTMTVKNQDIEIWAGDDQDLNFATTDGAGAVLNITGMTQAFDIYRNVGDLSSVYSIAGVITDGPNGKFKVTITTAQSATLDGPYYYFAVVIDGSGKRSTVASGKLFVHDEK